MISQPKSLQWWQKLGVWLATVLFTFGSFVSAAQATGVYDVPYATGDEPIWIVDQAEAISRANEGRLNRELSELAETTGKGLHFVAIRRLDYGQTMEEFTDKVFAKWFPTPEAGADEIVVAMDVLTNNVAIALGNNIQELIPPETAESITGETIGYPLRSSSYNQAFLDAEARIGTILNGEADPGPPDIAEINIESTFTKAEDTKTTSSTIWVVVLLLLATIIPMATYWWYVR
ncbi:photosystem II repair protein Psb32 [Synechococcus sp. BDU 130192]|uniref:photosystem II repair protein Psb32 n=1 Tax=Synechococcus sp. BDU 130192 TaxID=2042059 RepID=UPI000C06D91B|nr:TPM domain-containing protein [Synechococcus sp. BDU 130192]